MDHFIFNIQGSQNKMALVSLISNILMDHFPYLSITNIPDIKVSVSNSNIVPN